MDFTKPVMWRMVLIFFTMLCGLYICSICLKQFSAINTSSLLNVQVSNRPCKKPIIEPSDAPYVHHPKPNSYSRNECACNPVRYFACWSTQRSGNECACNPVRYFAILSTQRSGSGWFETLLNSHMNISSNGEIFSVKVRRTNVSTIVETLDQLYNLDWFSSAAKNECTAAVGLKWMLNQGVMQHHEEIVDYFNTKGVSVIFLFRRNLLRRMISILANSYDRDNKLLNGTHKSHVHSPLEAEILASYKPTVNLKLLIPDLNKVNEMRLKALGYYNTTRNMLVYYEDVVKNSSKLVEVQDFLKVPRMNLTSRQVKIHKGPLSEQIANWGDVEKTLKGTEYENLLRSDYRL